MTVSGAPAAKAARLVAPDEPVMVAGPGPRFVSRGGEKLDAALDRFQVVVEAKTALDAGSSTGGFTDCLLQRGARHVVALDVGRHQLHERLRADPRVSVHERTDLRAADGAVIGAPFPLLVADLSFISLLSVVDPLLALARPGADVVLLVKPQFEAGRVEASRGRGVIGDPAVWERVLAEVMGALRDRGATIMDAMVSPLTGADGNVEFLLHVLTPGGAVPTGTVEAPDPATLAAVATDSVAAVEQQGR